MLLPYEQLYNNLEILQITLKLQIGSIVFHSTMLFCLGILAKTSSGMTHGWLGGSDETTEDTWVWTDGSPGNLF